MTFVPAKQRVVLRWSRRQNGVEEGPQPHKNEEKRPHFRPFQAEQKDKGSRGDPDTCQHHATCGAGPTIRIGAQAPGINHHDHGGDKDKQSPPSIKGEGCQIAH